jgi:flagellar basal-body rod modification protein FlgD
MATDPIGGSSGTSSTTKKDDTNKAFDAVGTGEFLKLMIAELQNQDPLNPADNTALLTQLSQIRQVASSDKLSSTLDTVLLGQNLSNATSMIGKKVTALNDDNKDITGTVSKVTVTDGNVNVFIGDKSFKLNNIREILPTPAAA